MRANSLHEWLDASVGRAARLAEDIGVSPSAISQWRYFGVPPRHWQAVREATRGGVTAAAMARHRDSVRSR